MELGDRERIEPPRLVALIPARLNARRLPRKPLRALNGYPLIIQTWRRVREIGVADEVAVVTDAEEIEQVVCEAGGRVIRVDEPCASGTERIARALPALRPRPAHVLNVQCDQPFVDGEALRRLAGCLRQGAAVATLAAPLEPHHRGDPNRVKVVCASNGQALYFSRAPVPGDLHLGVYGFATCTLEALALLPRGRLASAEDLEQLTWLEAGYPIAVVKAPRATPSIDTPADLAAAQTPNRTDHPSNR